LEELQAELFRRAAQLRDEHTRHVDSKQEFIEYFTPKNIEQPELHGGFAWAHWSEGPELDRTLADLKVTVRCVPLEQESPPGKCIFTGTPSSQRALFAKAY
jgi:prolyl-tRNA synthetase